MEEQLISFETAKLAHSKGFDIVNSNNTLYFLDKSYPPPPKTGVKQLKSWLEAYKKNPKDNRYNRLYLRPTQSLLQKWLREKHFIYMNITPVTFVGTVVYYKGDVATSAMVWDKPIQVKTGKYEEVLERVLKEGLKLVE